MIGGEAKVLRRMKPYLAPLRKTSFISAARFQAHHEAHPQHGGSHYLPCYLRGCPPYRTDGDEVRDMVNIFNVSPPSAMPAAIAFRITSNGSWNAQARIYNPWKDVGLAVRLAHECGADVEFGERTLAFSRKKPSPGA